MTTLRHFDMFSGYGGFTIPCEELGIETVGFSEINSWANAVLNYRFTGVKNYGDATQIIADNVPDFDFLTGGFPCQSFSIAGKRRGLEDVRGTLFYEIARIVSVKRPAILLLENVAGLLSHDNGRTFGTILDTFWRLGYICEWQILNSKDFGVPQSRERVFVLGYSGKTPRPEILPFVSDDEESNGTEQIRRQSAFEKIKDYTDVDKDGRNNDSRRLIQFEEKKEDYSNIKLRYATPNECERLFGLQDDWTKYGLIDNNIVIIKDANRYELCGNGVVVNVAREIIKRIAETLK